MYYSGDTVLYINKADPLVLHWFPRDVALDALSFPKLIARFFVGCFQAAPSAARSKLITLSFVNNSLFFLGEKNYGNRVEDAVLWILCEIF